MKIMISLPMKGKTNEEIEAQLDKAIDFLEGNGHEVIDTLFEDVPEGTVTEPVALLAGAISAMSQCHAVYFCEGWKEARGCKFEHEIAMSYGIPVMYENTGRRRRSPSPTA